jgi:hypothetical protein
MMTGPTNNRMMDPSKAYCKASKRTPRVPQKKKRVQPPKKPSR